MTAVTNLNDQDQAPVQDEPAPAKPHPSQPEHGDASADKKPGTQPGGEQGGPKGPEPTRFGDWEKGGRCFDF
ncbi:MAG: DUF1674 domain-containing protein [Geminicoccaceae bacterium]